MDGAVDDEAALVEALTLLESQRMALLMYTSCAWFFNDLAGIETVQILRYAAQAASTCSWHWASPRHRGRGPRHAGARPQQRPRRGRRPGGVAPARRGQPPGRTGRIAAHLAMTGCWHATAGRRRRGASTATTARDLHDAPTAAGGRVRRAVVLTHRRTRRTTGLAPQALHLGGVFEVFGAVRPAPARATRTAPPATSPPWSRPLPG